MESRTRQPRDNRRKAITFTLLFHAFLVASIILGIEFSDYRPLSGPKVDIVEAEIVTTPLKPRVDPEVERRKREAEERQRQAEIEAQRKREAEEQARQQREEAQREQAEAETRQKAEAETRRKAELEAQQKAQAEAEARRKAELAAEQKAKAETEARRKAEEEARRKAEEEARKKAELEAKRKAEEEAKRRQAEEEARLKAEAERQARERAMQEALAQEQRERELNPLRDAYSAAISQQISRNWLRPQGISDDLKCEVHVVQMPDGNVTSAKITKSSGNTVFDESVIKAIYKAAPLPQPPSPEVFDRELKIAFCSTGNLC